MTDTQVVHHGLKTRQQFFFTRRQDINLLLLAFNQTGLVRAARKRLGFDLLANIVQSDRVEFRMLLGSKGKRRATAPLSAAAAPPDWVTAARL